MNAHFDPTDSKYQINKDFQPNKETQWPYPKEKDGMLLALLAQIYMVNIDYSHTHFPRYSMIFRMGTFA
jgi:hypothetical protein